MNDEEIIRRLINIPLFQEMSDDELRIISKVAKKKSYQVEEIVFKEGDLGCTLYLINRGLVKITQPIEGFNNKHELVSVLKEGDCFSELSLFDKKVHSTRAIAIEDTDLLEFGNESYENLINEDLRLGLEIQKKIILKTI